MKLHIYAFKDKDLGCFLQPYYTDTTPGNSATHLTRFLSQAESDKVRVYRHRSLYHLGVFDDEKGTIELVNNGTALFLLNCDSVLEDREKRERVETDGKAN